MIAPDLKKKSCSPWVELTTLHFILNFIVCRLSVLYIIIIFSLFCSILRMFFSFFDFFFKPPLFVVVASWWCYTTFDFFLAHGRLQTVIERYINSIGHFHADAGRLLAWLAVGQASSCITIITAVLTTVGSSRGIFYNKVKDHRGLRSKYIYSPNKRARVQTLSPVSINTTNRLQLSQSIILSFILYVFSCLSLSLFSLFPTLLLWYFKSSL